MTGITQSQHRKNLLQLQCKAVTHLGHEVHCVKEQALLNSIFEEYQRQIQQLQETILRYHTMRMHCMQKLRNQ